MNVTLYRMPDRPDAKLFRLPRWTAMIILYLTFCLAGIFDLRSALMQYAITAPQLFFGAVTGESVAVHGSIYLLAGLLDATWFELLLHVFVNMVRARFPHIDGANARHVVRVFFIFRNVMLAGLDLVLYWHPIAVGMTLYFASFLVTTAFSAGAYFYFASKHLPRFLVGQGLAIVAQYFFGYHALVVLLYLVMGVTF